LNSKKIKQMSWATGTDACASDEACKQGITGQGTFAKKLFKPLTEKQVIRTFHPLTCQNGTPPAKKSTTK
jgi:hypothetical protein